MRFPAGALLPAEPLTAAHTQFSRFPSQKHLTNAPNTGKILVITARGVLRRVPEVIFVKKLHRILSIASAAVLSAAAVAMFTACDSAEPEIVITYNFLGEDYEVEYTLSRKGAPQTVQHFIELADAGYYDGTCIHHYVDDAFLYGGAYVWDEETESIVEKDYYSEVKNLNLTQTVYTLGENGKRGDPLYTVRGEFEANGVEGNTKTLSHTQGALAMFYTGKGNSSVRVGSIRSDGGDYQEGDYYKYNCATSMFYTFTGAGTRTELDKYYTVFGRTSNFSQMQDLLDAIRDYIDTLGSADAFVDSGRYYINEHDPYDAVTGSTTFSGENISSTYDVPVEPIIVKSVEVTKY